jgi:hypothetical protein
MKKLIKIDKNFESRGHVPKDILDTVQNLFAIGVRNTKATYYQT